MRCCSGADPDKPHPQLLSAQWSACRRGNGADRTTIVMTAISVDGMQSPFPISEAPEAATADEQQLVAEVLAKDRKATADFVARCADWLYSFIRHRLAPRTEMVEDLMQETLLAAWQGLPNFRGDAGLRSWVLGIARHKVEDYYRRRIREAELRAQPNEDDEDVAPVRAIMPMFEHNMDSAIQHGLVQATLARLPEAYALAL